MTATQLAASDTLADILIDRYIATWNIIDAAQRRALIAQTWTESATYDDPLTQGAGHGSTRALIASVQTKFPGFRLARNGSTDVVQDTIRFHWTLRPEGQVLIKDTDFIHVEDDCMQTATGFINQMPGMSGAD